MNPIFNLYYLLVFILKHVERLQAFILVLFRFIPDPGRKGLKEFKYLTLLYYFLILDQLLVHQQRSLCPYLLHPLAPHLRLFFLCLGPFSGAQNCPDFWGYLSLR